MKLITYSLIAVLGVVLVQTILADEPPTFTIQQVQQRQGVSDGDRVRIIGIAPAPTSRWGYDKTMLLDAAGGDYSGIMVYDANERLAAEKGDVCSVVGIVEEYYDKTEIVATSETEFPPQITGSGTVPPPIETTTANADQEKYECCLLMIRNAEVLSAPDQYGNIAINDGSGEFVLLLRLKDPVPEIGHVYDCLTGINDYSFEEFKIRPRDESDWSCTGVPPTATPSLPTPTPGGPTPTPSPTPPGGPCDPALNLFFQDHDAADCFIAGDSFYFRAGINNPCDNGVEIDLYVVLEVTGMYFFFPTWVQYPELAKAPVLMQSNDQIVIDIIPQFTWPSGAGSLSGINFIGFMTQPDTFNVVGGVEFITFCYN